MYSVIDLEEITKKFNIRFKGLDTLQNLLKGAMLDPDENIRADLAKTLNKKLNNSLQRAFIGDNYLLVTLQKPGLPQVTYAVCDLPKTYCGMPAKPHKITRKA